jgi:DNA repair exonuclease SbcCD nuclease subunit
MFKKLLVTDTHLGMYSDSDAWLDIVLNFYKYITKYCIKHDIREIYHLGDFFDNRKSLNTKTQHVAHRIAKVLGLKENLHTYIIVGNHDCYYKNKIHPNTLELFKEYDNISIIDSIEKIDNILLVPWGEVPEDTQGARFCFGHFAIKGFHMNDSYKCKDGLDKVKFKDFEKVLSGHFHTPSSKGNITYLGSPYGQTFHDAGVLGVFTYFRMGILNS